MESFKRDQVYVRTKFIKEVFNKIVVLCKKTEISTTKKCDGWKKNIARLF